MFSPRIAHRGLALHFPSKLVCSSQLSTISLLRWSHCPETQPPLRTPRASPFSTMPASKAHADYALHQPTASVDGGKAYDPEITDIASYVHNYKIDSDLAVNSLLPHKLSWTAKATIRSSRPLAMSFSIRLGADWQRWSSRSAPSF